MPNLSFIFVMIISMMFSIAIFAAEPTSPGAIREDTQPEDILQFEPTSAAPTQSPRPKARQMTAPSAELSKVPQRVSGNKAARISYFGDSQSAASYGLFSQLRSKVMDAGHDFGNGQAVCSARMEHFSGFPSTLSCGHASIIGGDPVFSQERVKTLDIAELAKTSDTVVVQLGDNHLKDKPATLKAAALALAKRVSEQGKACIFIGPAAVSSSACRENAERKKIASELLEQALKETQCQYVNSYKLTEVSPPDSSDCLHYTASGYKKWSDAIQGRLNELLGAVPGSNGGANQPKESGTL